MAIDVYWISGSTPSWRVLLALEFKGLDYESYVLEASKREHKEAWFLDLNPRGLVPVLKDEDTVICESQAIIHYLERFYAEPSLFGNTPAETARSMQAMYEIHAYLDRPVDDVVGPIFRGQVEKSREVMSKAAVSVHKELANIDSALSYAPWLSGEQAGGADIALVPPLQRLLRAIVKSPEMAGELQFDDFSERYPAVVSWNETVETLPAFKASFPPHWKG